MKKTQLVTSIALAAALAITPAAMLGCSGDHYSEVNFSAQDTAYAVTSQGGSAVAYGNNIYFVNGYRGYSDSDGTANVWNDVVKGALYRAQLNGERDANNSLEFVAQADGEGIAFKYEKGKDYFDNEINVVGTTKIAPKTIGTSGYSSGGLFIYDNYAYFASPNNEKNKGGTVQTTRTDFFMMPLSGGKPTKLYTTTEKVDTSSSPYAFYKYGGSVYLVVKEDTNIVSVKVNTSKAKADDPVIFKVGATSVYLPVKDTYYNGISTNDVEDFIYFVREVKDSDTQKAGTVIEAMRPDGSENFVVSMTNATETIEAVRDGLLFYRTTEVNETKLKYTNLHNMLMEHSASYKNAQDAITDEDKKTTDITGTFPISVSSSITSTYAFRADKNSNDVYFVGVTSNGMTLYQNDDSNPVKTQTLCTTSGTPQFIKDGYLYFAGSSSDYYRTPLFESIDSDNFGEAQLLAENTSSATFGCDYAAGYFTYYAEVDQWASGYAYFVDMTHEGAEPIFVGQRASSDIPSQEQIDEAKGETE
ncbi:MAG: hypothetical protein K2K13_03220 [Clostridiales bacterium]|nr:hypothetical protein [Clostridiales bacterium]